MTQMCTTYLPGEKYGHLLIKALVDGDSGSRVCECLRCGNWRTLPVRGIRSGNTKSCGCLKVDVIKQRWKRISAAQAEKNVFLLNLRNNAQRRTMAVSASPEEILCIAEQPCVYCGAAPTLRTGAKRKREWGRKHKGTDEIYYKNPEDVWYANGIDRVDSDYGYISGNMVACCKTCNTMKNSLSLQEFLEHIKRIYNHQFDVQVAEAQG